MSVNVVDKSTGNVTRVAGNASDSGIGNLDSLTTQNKSSLVAAINEVNSADGDSIFEGTQQEWSDLSTAEKTAYDFAAITDDYTPGSIGNLNSLTTTDKSSVVGAVNELNSDKKDEYITITYAQWQQLTPAQQAAKDYYISDYPSSAITAGNVSYNNTTSGMTADDVQEAVDELSSGLNSLRHSFTLRSYRLSDTYTSSYILFEKDISLTGWYPIAIAGYNSSHVTVNISALRVGSSENKLYCDAYNITGNTLPADFVANVVILYCKNIMV